MSVAGLSGGGIELVGHSGVADEPTVLDTTSSQNQQNQNQQMARNTSRARFEIEDVDEPDHHDPQLSASGQVDLTVHSFGYNTAEAVPMTVYYRNTSEAEGKARPSLDNLRQRERQENEPTVHEEAVVQEESAAPSVKKKWWQFWKGSNKPLKFGWITGVLIRCLLNIWGVMLFIRLSWVTGQTGIGLASVIILLSAVVTVITTLSMSAICTNGEVKGGGAYYLISRSLGPEFGGAIGVIFSLANAVAVALYVVGFAETVADLVIEYHGSSFTGARINDIRVVGLILVLLLCGIALIGLDWEAKVQLVLLVILLIAIVDFFIGTFIPRSPTSEDSYRGFTGYSGRTFVSNFVPDFKDLGTSDIENFFVVFAVFFPAATGILAGANISGDLKDPQKAIPKGTLLAIAITTVTYLVMAWLSAIIVVREAPGSPNDFFMDLLMNDSNGTDYVTIPFAENLMTPCETVYNLTEAFPSCDLSSCSCTNNTVCDDIFSCLPTVDCLYGSTSADSLNALCSVEFLQLIGKQSCEFGTLNNFQVMEMVSAWGPLVTAGIFAATLSSALTSFVSAPKVFQRVCQDKVFPLIYFFAKGGGRSGTEPIRGYFLTLIIAIGCIAIGDLNEIALIISNFFLMAYTLINYSCFAASFAQSPGWRPGFKFYNKWVALFGAAICVAIMFIIRWYYALITFIVVLILYKIVDFLKPDINWGSSTQAFLYSYSMRNLLKLEKLEDHVKNFRPQLLVLTGPPSSRPDLVHFLSHISKEVGVMICGDVLLGDYNKSRHDMLTRNVRQRKWLRSEKVKAFYNVVSAKTLREGTQNLLMLSGLGKIRPNTLVLGFKNNWKESSTEEVEEYVSLLHDAFDLNFGLVIFRLRAGFDATERMIENPAESVAVKVPSDDGGKRVSFRQESPSLMVPPSQPLIDPKENPSAAELKAPPSRIHSYNRYDSDEQDSVSVDSYTLAMEEGARVDFGDDPPTQTEQEEGESQEDTTPEIITMPSRFDQVQEKGYIDVWWLYDDGGLAILLPFLISRNKHWKDCKLRIFTPGSSRKIDQAKLRMTNLLRKFRINFSAVIEVPGMSNSPSSQSIDKYRQLPSDDMDDKSLDKRTLRHIRLGELLQEHSSEARLIVMTITVPRWDISARQYMSWLEIMSQNLPPILLMRGNQTSVLTFYS